MNRKQRRDLEKQVKRINKIERQCHKTLTSVQSLLGMMAMKRVQNGTADSKDIEILRNSDFAHLDNEMACPNGTKCKLNVEAVQARPQDDLTDKFKNWIEANRDKEFTITREGARNSLVCLAEDETEPKWLFDLYTDLLIFDEATNSYLPLETIADREEEEIFTGVGTAPEQVTDSQDSSSENEQDNDEQDKNN